MTDLPIEIDVQAVRQLQQQNEDFLFIDCREPGEYETARIEGTVLIPMGEITSRVDELAGNEEKRVVVHCHLGGRSLRVTQWLRTNGFRNAQNMSGGIEAWSNEVDSTVPRY